MQDSSDRLWATHQSCQLIDGPAEPFLEVQRTKEGAAMIHGWLKGAFLTSALPGFVKIGLKSGKCCLSSVEKGLVAISRLHESCIGIQVQCTRTYSTCVPSSAS